MKTSYKYYNSLKIIHRDGYECQMCHKQPRMKELVIHHLDRNKQNSDPNNLITLCYSCHNIVHKEDRNYAPRNFDIEKQVVALRKKGTVYKKIGEILGFSTQRASQIYARYLAS